MYYAGLDAHLNYLQVAVLDSFGKLALNTKVSTRQPEELEQTLARYRPLEVVVETRPFWPWIYDLLVPAGITFHLAHAKDLRFIAKPPQKKDAVDAALLARLLLSGLIPKAYPRGPAQGERPNHRRMWMLADNDGTTTLVTLRATTGGSSIPLAATRFIGVRSTIRPPSLSDRLCNCQGAPGRLEQNLHCVREHGARRAASSWRTFGAPRPVLSPALTQRDMEPEVPPPRPPRPPRSHRRDDILGPALYAVIPEVQH